MNTHETYVSLETAKLLKQAGFDWECNRFYDCTNSDCVRYEEYPAPTLDVAQRWLREVKGMCLTIQPLFDKVNEQFNVVVGFTPFIHRMDGEMIIASLDNEHSYEKAQEAGIKKCLTLILEDKQ